MKHAVGQYGGHGGFEAQFHYHISGPLRHDQHTSFLSLGILLTHEGILILVRAV